MKKMEQRKEGREEQGDKEFDTFRGESAVSKRKKHEESLNETLPTVLDASNIRSHSPTGLLKGSTIRCPVFPPEAIYNCEICSQLRLVCPHKSNYQQKGKIKIEDWKGTIHKNITGTVHINTEFNESKIEGDKRNTTVNFVPGRAQTPQFQNFRDLDVKFADSLPYIKHPDGTERTNYNMTQPRITLNNQPLFNRSAQLSTTHDTHSPLIRHQTPSQRPLHFHQQTMYTPAPSKHIIEQIIYQPVIVNKFVMPQTARAASNPESMGVTPRKEQYFVPGEGSGDKLGDSQFSPVNNSRMRCEYNAKGVMTPENFKKLADSIIR